MPRQNVIQESWGKGEISPLARGRVGVNLYTSGAETIENLIVRPQGPLFRRSGTKFVNSSKAPTERCALIPFEVSDEQAYMLELGKGYIRFFKNKEPIFDTATSYFTNVTAYDNGGLMQLGAESISSNPTSVGQKFGDMPTFDIQSIAPFNDAGSDRYQVTTTVPHGLKVGAKVFILNPAAGASNVGGSVSSVTSATPIQITLTSSDTIFPTTGNILLYNSTNHPLLNGIFGITRVSANNYTLDSTTAALYGSGLADMKWAKEFTVLSVTPRSFKIAVNTMLAAAASAQGFVVTNGLSAGDKFAFGTSDYAQLSSRNMIAKSVENANRWTVANLDDQAGSPTGEAYTIPIEIDTPYGYGPAITVSGTDNSSGFVNVTTVNPHGLTTGDTVVANGCGAGVDGEWTVTVSTDTIFYLNESVYNAVTSGGTIRKVLGASEFDIRDLKFAQSADVLYIAHPLYPTQKLTRLSDDGDRNDWLLAECPFRDGPYMGLNDLAPLVNETTPADGSVYPDVYMEVSAYAHTATVKAAVAFDNADDNKYIEWKEGDQWRLAQLGTLAGGETSVSVTVFDNVMLGIDETTILKQKTVGSTTSSGAIYRSYGASGKSSPAGYYSRTGAYLGRIDPGNEVASDKPLAAGAIVAGTITSQYSNTFAAADVGKWIRIKSSARTAASYWVQITQIGDGAGGATTSNKAQHSASVAMSSNNETGKFVVSAHTRTCTLTAKKAGATFAAFRATDVGRKVRLGYAGRWTWGIITAYTSTSVVTLTLYEDMPRDPNDATRIAGNQEAMKADGTLPTTSLNTGITYDWRMGAWSATSGYPANVVFHEQRLVFGATTTEPQTLWFSASGDFENMLPTELDSTVLDDNAIVYTLASAKANPIRWMVSGPSLGVGTAGGEWQVRAASSTNDPITPASITAKEHTSLGSRSRVRPARVGSSIIFVDRSGEKVHELFYSYELDAIDSDELTVISEHIIRNHGGAVCAAYQQKPHSIYWVACADGTLSAMTYNKKQEIVSWHHHTVDGATVEWLATIPSADGSEDELWMVCARTVNGSTYRTIEVMESDFYPSSSTSRSGMTFQDGHIVIPSGDPYFTGTTISGLNWLAGDVVTVTADGVRLTGTYTVTSGGTITLSANTYDEIVIGPNPNADLGSLPPEGGSAFGTSQAMQKKIVDISLRVYNTANVSYGPDTSNLTSRNLYSGTFQWVTNTVDKLIPKSGYGPESKYYIRQSEPYPLNILFVVLRLETNE